MGGGWGGNTETMGEEQRIMGKKGKVCEEDYMNEEDMNIPLPLLTCLLPAPLNAML